MFHHLKIPSLHEIFHEIAAERGESPLNNGRSGIFHEVHEEVQIMPATKPCGKYFSCGVEVTDVGSGEISAHIAITCWVYR